MAIRGYFHDYVEQQRRSASLILQPRMGFGSASAMRAGLDAVRATLGPRIGTITVDSFTRMGDLAAVRRALDTGRELNGYPIASCEASRNHALIAGLLAPDFPIQVRHGSAVPNHIVEATLAAGLDAIEGGPISYCLPYSRVPLSVSVSAWSRACRTLAEAEATHGLLCHLESFGGCMLGQLCPPALLLALVILEGIFSDQHGLSSVSLSLAQGTNAQQDVSALLALRRLAERFLPRAHWHVVFYTFMGKFAETREGAQRLIAESVAIALSGKCERMICKTLVESRRIPSVADNVLAMQWARESCRRAPLIRPNEQLDLIFKQATFLIEMVLDLHPDLSQAMTLAFRKGLLDVPYCLHPDNHNRARVAIDQVGNIGFSRTGAIPLPSDLVDKRAVEHSSRELLRMLSFNQRKYDSAGAGDIQPAAHAQEEGQGVSCP